MFTHDYLCLPMITPMLTRVYLCLIVHVYRCFLCLHVYICLPTFTYVYLCLNVYNCLPMFTPVYSFYLFSTVHSCSLMFSRVYLRLLVFTRIYQCLHLFYHC